IADRTAGASTPWFAWAEQLTSYSVRTVSETRKKTVARLGLMLSAGLVLVGAPVRAMDLYADDSVEIRWDNTLRYSAAVRLAGQDASLLAKINNDDGDRNFAPG